MLARVTRHKEKHAMTTSSLADAITIDPDAIYDG
jgi:hypothetical protein